jgi:hypothetical protein
MPCSSLRKHLACYELQCKLHGMQKTCTNGHAKKHTARHLSPKLLSSLFCCRHQITRASPVVTPSQKLAISSVHACAIGSLNSMLSLISTSWSKRAALQFCEMLLRASCRQRITRAEPCTPPACLPCICAGLGAGPVAAGTNGAN